MTTLLPKGGVRRPSVFALQIGKQPILAFEAISLLEARELAKEDWLLADLRAARSGGRPIWDGKSSISIGAAIDEDVDIIRQKLQMIQGTDDLPIVYLIKLDQ